MLKSKENEIEAFSFSFSFSFGQNRLRPSRTIKKSLILLD
jgi:hypothetical protein